jgi:nucleoside-diphosphate-sugar epimerase
MKILITGNMGYVGPIVVKHLRRTHPDAELIGVDTGYFASNLTGPEMFPECLLNRQYFADMRNLPDNILNGIDAIVHLAAISNDPMGKEFEQVTHEINFQAGIDLAKKAKASGVRTFVFASSCSMYGSADDKPRTEESSLNPLTAYAKSKVLMESSLKELADKDFLVTSLRFSTACGMSSRLRLDLVLNDFVACAVATKKITILSDGTPWRPLINVKDMARAIEWGVDRPADNGGAFLAVNVGSDQWNYQVRELAEAVVKVIPDVQISINKDAPPDKRSYRVNFSKFRSLAPDHQPQIDLLTSVRELKQGLESFGFKDSNFRESNLIRLKALKSLQDKGLITKNLRLQ